MGCLVLVEKVLEYAICTPRLTGRFNRKYELILSILFKGPEYDPAPPKFGSPGINQFGALTLREFRERHLLTAGWPVPRLVPSGTLLYCEKGH